MAIKLGQIGCKLSLSDVNTAGLEETKQICMKNGVSAEKICTFFCDVSRRESVREAAIIARQTHGVVTLLINNAGIVSGKSTLELSD